MESLASIDLEAAHQFNVQAKNELMDANAATHLSLHLCRSAVSLAASRSNSLPSQTSSKSSEITQQVPFLPLLTAANLSISPAECALKSQEALAAQKLTAAWQAVYSSEWRSKMLISNANVTFDAAAKLRQEAAQIQESLLYISGEDVLMKTGAAQDEIAALEKSAAALMQSGDADMAMSRCVAESSKALIEEATALAAQGAGQFGSLIDEDEDPEEMDDDWVSYNNETIDWEVCPVACTFHWRWYVCIFVLTLWYCLQHLVGLFTWKRQVY